MLTWGKRKIKSNNKKLPCDKKPPRINTSVEVWFQKLNMVIFELCPPDSHPQQSPHPPTPIQLAGSFTGEQGLALQWDANSRGKCPIRKQPSSSVKPMTRNERSWDGEQQRGKEVSFSPPFHPDWAQPLPPSPWAVGRKMAQHLSSQPPLPVLTSFFRQAMMQTQDNRKPPTLLPHSEFISFITFRTQPDISMSLQCHVHQVALQLSVDMS